MTTKRWMTALLAFTLLQTARANYLVGGPHDPALTLLDTWVTTTPPETLNDFEGRFINNGALSLENHAEVALYGGTGDTAWWDLVNTSFDLRELSISYFNSSAHSVWRVVLYSVPNDTYSRFTGFAFDENLIGQPEQLYDENGDFLGYRNDIASVAFYGSKVPESGATLVLIGIGLIALCTKAFVAFVIRQQVKIARKK